MKTYAISDLHGCYGAWRKIIEKLAPEDKLYILGDCIDRNYGGLAILQEAIEDPRCVVLCGNHEDMMADALEYEILFGESDYWIWRWFKNGGEETFEEWKAAGRDPGWVEKIHNLPLWAEYVNTQGDRIMMTHSGVTPKGKWPLSSLTRRALLWDRNCLRELYWHKYDDEYVVFGHTPCQIMDKYCGCGDAKAPLVFCDGHKINIDNGAAWTGEVCLLDLDTFESEIIANG